MAKVAHCKTTLFAEEKLSCIFLASVLEEFEFMSSGRVTLLFREKKNSGSTFTFDASPKVLITRAYLSKWVATHESVDELTKELNPTLVLPNLCGIRHHLNASSLSLHQCSQTSLGSGPSQRLKLNSTPVLPNLFGISTTQTPQAEPNTRAQKPLYNQLHR